MRFGNGKEFLPDMTHHTQITKEEIPMKRFLLLMLALMLVAFLVACDTEIPEAPTEAPTEASTEEDITLPADTAPTETELEWSEPEDAPYDVIDIPVVNAGEGKELHVTVLFKNEIDQLGNKVRGDRAYRTYDKSCNNVGGVVDHKIIS